MQLRLDCRCACRRNDFHGLDAARIYDIDKLLHLAKQLSWGRNNQRVAGFMDSDGHLRFPVRWRAASAPPASIIASNAFGSASNGEAMMLFAGSVESGLPKRSSVFK